MENTNTTCALTGFSGPCWAFDSLDWDVNIWTPDSVIAPDEEEQADDHIAVACAMQVLETTEFQASEKLCTSGWDYTRPEADTWAPMSSLQHAVIWMWDENIGNYVLHNCEPQQPGGPLRHRPGAINYDIPNYEMAREYQGKTCTFLGRFPRAPRKFGKRNGIAGEQAIWNFHHRKFRNILPQECWDKVVAEQVTKWWPIPVDLLFRPYPKEDVNKHRAFSGALWASYGKLDSRLKPGEYDLGLMAYSGMTSLAGARAQFYENNVFRIEIDLFWAQPATYRYWPFTSPESRQEWGHLRDFDIEFELGHVRHIIISTKGVSGPSNWCDAIRVIKAFRRLESVVFDFRHDAKREVENFDSKDIPEKYPTFPAGRPFLEGLEHLGVNVQDIKISIMQINKRSWFYDYKEDVRAVLMPKPRAIRHPKPERIYEPYRPTGNMALKPRDLYWKPEYGSVPKSLKKFLRRKVGMIPWDLMHVYVEDKSAAAAKRQARYKELVAVLGDDESALDD